MLHNEQERLENLLAYRVLDSAPSKICDRIVELAAQLFQAPIAAISLVDKDRQWFKAQVGLGVSETPRAWSFCSTTIEQSDEVFVVPRPEIDPRFQDNPLVVGAPFIRFYAGARMVDSRGFVLGALCVIDTSARPYPTETERACLVDLARFATQQLELQKTHRELAEKERLLTMAEKMSGVGHWRYEIDSGRVTWSDEIYKFFGLQPSAKPLSFAEALDRYPPEDRERVQEAVKKAIATGEGYGLERKLLGRDNVLRTTRSTTVCEINDHGSVEALFGVFQDITDHVNALEAAQTATETKSEFLANMSHELRTPLTSVIGYAALLRDLADLNGDAKYYVDQVLTASNALMATINDVLDFSKLESGQLSIDREPVSVRTLLKEVASLFGPQADTKGLRISSSVEETVPEGLLLDINRVRQILINLVSNAIKFTLLGGVTVRAKFIGGKLIIDVTDTGCGIPPEKLGLLFQRFSQIDGSSRRLHNGTGLGLAICKGLAEAMGGKIDVTSTPDLGSSFSVSLPTETIAPQNVANALAPLTVSLKGYRILLVDDCEANLQLVKDILSTTGIKITSVRSGAQALKAHQEDFFDLVLLDLHMPDIDGFATAQCFRADVRRSPAIPIIAFTADSESAETLARDIGSSHFDGVITKPVLPRSLILTVAAALGVTGRMEASAA